MYVRIQAWKDAAMEGSSGGQPAERLPSTCVSAAMMALGIPALSPAQPGGLSACISYESLYKTKSISQL